MKTFTFILKSGARFDVKCKHLTMKHIGNELTSYEMQGLLPENDYPMYIRIEEVAAVIELANDGERKDVKE